MRCRCAFPAVERIVGEEFFQAMARAYVLAEPPRSPVLMDYGTTFADFIAGFAPAASLPYLPDVARIERAWREAYHAEDAEPLGPEAFAGIGADAISGPGAEAASVAATVALALSGADDLADERPRRRDRAGRHFGRRGHAHRASRSGGRGA